MRRPPRLHGSRTSLLAAIAVLLAAIAPVLAAASPAASPAAAAADPTLVAAFGFGEGSGSSLGDSSGRGHTGAITNGTWSGAGKFGGALSFNGTSSVVTVPDAADLRLTTGMTLEAWVSPSAGGGWRDVVYKGDDVMTTIT